MNPSSNNMKILYFLAASLLLSGNAVAQMPAFPHFQGDSIAEHNYTTKLKALPDSIDTSGTRYITYKETALMDGYTPAMSNRDLFLYFLYAYDALTYASSLPLPEAIKVIRTVNDESYKQFWGHGTRSKNNVGAWFFKYTKGGYFEECRREPDIWYSAEKMNPYIAQAKQLKKALIDARGKDMESFLAEHEQGLITGHYPSGGKLKLLEQLKVYGLLDNLVSQISLINMTHVAINPDAGRVKVQPTIITPDPFRP